MDQQQQQPPQQPQQQQQQQQSQSQQHASQQQPQVGGVPGPAGRRLHIAHRRSPSELTPLMSMFANPGMEQLAIQQQIELLQQQQQQIQATHQQYVSMGMMPPGQPLGPGGAFNPLQPMPNMSQAAFQFPNQVPQQNIAPLPSHFHIAVISRHSPTWVWDPLPHLPPVLLETLPSEALRPPGPSPRPRERWRPRWSWWAPWRRSSEKTLSGSCRCQEGRRTRPAETNNYRLLIPCLSCPR
ncbi:hypothetical protein NXS19_012047 [Fusarium pseudograminearum]|nr:hypothetical protein NXS19_012047 [Fusarium pseudograminearum]